MKILMPIDGSNCSRKTLEWAAETFNPGTEYYLLFVVQVLPDLNTVEYNITDATAMLRKAREEMEARGMKVVRTDYVLGDTVERICQYAEEMDADQVVLGSHGRTGLARLLMGSVSARVLEHCNRPVTVHRNVERKPARPKEEHHESAHYHPNTAI